jgi:hypothetical protein
VWTPAQDCTAKFAGGLLTPADFEPVSIVSDLPAINMTSPPPGGSVLVDVGKNFAGLATLQVSNVPAGYTVRVWPSETMYDGAIDQSSGGTPMYWQAHGDVRAAPGSVTNVTVSPTFSIYGWRWLKVELVRDASFKSSSAGPNGTITVLSASYGQNCGAAVGDVTGAVAAYCDGKDPCGFQICVCGDNTCGAGAPPCITDPASNCAKDFAVTYRCTADSPSYNRTNFLPAEADNQVAPLSCGPPPLPPPSPEVVSATGRFVRSAVKSVGTWTSSNAWVNQIHAITLEAIAANLQSVLTDCPHRERLGWLEVSHLMAPSIAFNFDISRLWRKISVDTLDSQLASGMVPDIAPEYTVFSGGFRDSPEWGSAGTQNPAWLFELYGDLDIVNTSYSANKNYLDYLLSQRTPEGLLTYGLGDWIPVVNSPPGVTGTGTLIQNLQVLARTAAALGLGADAQNFTALAADAIRAYEAAFNPKGDGVYPTQAAAGYGMCARGTDACPPPPNLIFLSIRPTSLLSSCAELFEKHRRRARLHR